MFNIVPGPRFQTGIQIVLGPPFQMGGMAFCGGPRSSWASSWAYISTYIYIYIYIFVHYILKLNLDIFVKLSSRLSRILKCLPRGKSQKHKWEFIKSKDNVLYCCLKHHSDMISTHFAHQADFVANAIILLFSDLNDHWENNGLFNAEWLQCLTCFQRVRSQITTHTRVLEHQKSTTMLASVRICP